MNLIIFKKVMPNIYLKGILNNRNFRLKNYSIKKKKNLPFSFHLVPQFAIHLQDLKEKEGKAHKHYLEK